MSSFQKRSLSADERGNGERESRGWGGSPFWGLGYSAAKHGRELVKRAGTKVSFMYHI